MRKRPLLSIVALCLVAAAVYVYFNFSNLVPYGAMAVNFVRYHSAPKGTLRTETAAQVDTALPFAQTDDDWPNYNKTLTGNRFSSLADINRQNVANMKVLCTYDTGEYTGFTSGVLEVNGAVYFSTEYNIYSIDPTDCKLNWSTHESYTPGTLQDVNRGPTYADGMLFRGTQDSRVIAYDAATGKQLWATSIGDPKKGESAPAAPIAWNGMVFIGNAGGDTRGVKGRMYALDEKTGKILWEFYLVPKSPGDPERGPQATSPLDSKAWSTGNSTPITGGGTWTTYTIDPDAGLLYVPGGNPAPDFAEAMRPGENLFTTSLVVLDAKTGAYKSHVKLVPKDWHDWDVSSAPALIKTAGGKNLITLAPKDGHLYALDAVDNKILYRVPVTRVENADVPFNVGTGVHFCPGSIGGAEWNGAAYDPQYNLTMVGEVEWCTTVTLASPQKINAIPAGFPWSGEASINPYNMWGKQDPFGNWAGWLQAVDADSGEWKWRAKTNYPVQSGVTPTAGGLVFFGDMGGNFYALNASTGEKLWGDKIGGAVGGGVITFRVQGKQKIAAATGLTEVLWPTEITTAKVSILGLPGT